MAEAERAQPIVDRHHHHVAALGEGLAVVEHGRARTDHEAAAVDPDQHRPAGAVEPGAEDVEREAVLAGGARGSVDPGEEGQRELRRSGARTRGVAHARPWRHWLRSPEPQRTDGRGGVWHAAKRVEPAFAGTLDPPRARLDDSRHDSPLTPPGVGAFYATLE